MPAKRIDPAQTKLLPNDTVHISYVKYIPKTIKRWATDIQIAHIRICFFKNAVKKVSYNGNIQRLTNDQYEY